MNDKDNALSVVLHSVLFVWKMFEICLKSDKFWSKSHYLCVVAPKFYVKKPCRFIKQGLCLHL